uniref:Uncharacterized protein n=1 Tax=Vespula pensylvanica TaxID=30213 RepID=A0A834JR57_VESPE|nr:hypothetical protein H0235_017110 [Vespula pensylvanica]
MIDRVGTSRRKIHGVFSSTEGKRYPEGNALAEKRTPSRYERIPTCFDDIRSFAVAQTLRRYDGKKTLPSFTTAFSLAVLEERGDDDDDDDDDDDSSLFRLARIAVYFTFRVPR